MKTKRKVTTLLVIAISLMIVGSYGVLAQPGAENAIGFNLLRAQTDTGENLGSIGCSRDEGETAVSCEDGDWNELDPSNPIVYVEEYENWTTTAWEGIRVRVDKSDYPDLSDALANVELELTIEVIDTDGSTLATDSRTYNSAGDFDEISDMTTSDYWVIVLGVHVYVDHSGSWFPFTDNTLDEGQSITASTTYYLNT